MIRFSYSTENKKKKKETEEQEKEEEEPCQHFLIVKDGSIRREVSSNKPLPVPIFIHTGDTAG